jgi:hypothetical protein
MLVGTSLNSIGFLSSSDSTRLQMSAKQLAQTCTHLNNKLPYTIGEDYKYLSNSSNLFKKIAEFDGEVLYSNDDIMVVGFITDTGISKIETYLVPRVKETANGFATQLRDKISSGSFDAGDVLYEYDCFSENIPCYGYNINTMWFPWFGYNFEDSVVISESFAERAIATKIKKLNIYIYKSTLFKFIYDDSKYGFIPEIGQKIKGKVILSQINANSINPYDYLNDNEISVTANLLTCRLESATINNIKIHRVDNLRYNLIDKNLEDYITKIRIDYATKVKGYSFDLQNNVGAITSGILASNYIMSNVRLANTNRDELVYVIELELMKEYPSELGDKLANRSMADFKFFEFGEHPISIN